MYSTVHVKDVLMFLFCSLLPSSPRRVSTAVTGTWYWWFAFKSLFCRMSVSMTYALGLSAGDFGGREKSAVYTIHTAYWRATLPLTMRGGDHFQPIRQCRETLIILQNYQITRCIKMIVILLLCLHPQLIRHALIHLHASTAVCLPTVGCLLSAHRCPSGGPAQACSVCSSATTQRQQGAERQRTARTAFHSANTAHHVDQNR